MRTTTCLAFGLVILALAPRPANAQSIDSAQSVEPAWSRVIGWPPGQRLIVTLESGDKVAGKLVGSSEDAFTLTDRTGVERTIRKADVRRVLGERPDSSLDGLLLGAAIGAGAGVLKGYDARTFECRARCSIAIGTTLFTPIGALVGWLRDRHQHPVELLFATP
jgi:hypothetical protein